MSTTASSIEWTDRTWNPTRGCRRVSPGCENCYAEKQAWRFNAPGQPYEGLVKLGNAGPVWTGRTHFVEHALAEPLSWRKPARVFVDSMSDLFFEPFTNLQIGAAFIVMAACPQHTFQVLTKRAERLPQWFEWAADHFADATRSAELSGWLGLSLGTAAEVWAALRSLKTKPLPNVWIGVSVEDQQRADERLPHLLKIPAAVRFVSYEPALGPVEFKPWMRGHCEYDSDRCLRLECEVVCPRHAEGIDWLIVGGESGPGARPMHPTWARQARDQCQAAGVPFFFKQWGEYAYLERNGGALLSPNGYWPVGKTADHVWDGPGLDEYTSAVKVGKKTAGRLLDGREWSELPRT